MLLCLSAYGTGALHALHLSACGDAHGQIHHGESDPHGFGWRSESGHCHNPATCGICNAITAVKASPVAGHAHAFDLETVETAAVVPACEFVSFHGLVSLAPRAPPVHF